MIDERFIKHRLYSTRFATAIAVIMMGFWFNYEYFANAILRWDLFIILTTTAVAKIGAMIYYRITD